jgi:SAM-dependent methyltransferase
MDSAPLEELPKKISINKRIFLQRMGGFYTPESDFLPHEISFYFNSIADDYEKVITVPLNKKVISYLILSILRRCERKGQKLRILDYGIGTGLSYDIVYRASYNNIVELYGVDISKKMVDICKQKGMRAVIQNNYFDIGFPRNFFDGIFASFSVHYFLDPFPFQLMAQRLKIGGVLAFNLHRPEDDYYEYYTEVLNKLGFEVIISKKRSVSALKVKNKFFEVPILIAKKTRSVNLPGAQIPFNFVS